MSLFTGGLRRAAERGRREIAHNALTPAFIGSATQRSLQTVITSEKDLIKRNTSTAAEFQRNIEALKQWGSEQERDLNDVLSKWASLFEAFPSALEELNKHLQEDVRTQYKIIRTKEEQLIDLRSKYRTLCTRIESVERKLAKMGPENKELPKTTSMLSELRAESSTMQLSIAKDQASLEDFKRSAMHSALGNKAAALTHLADQLAIMAQYAVGMLDELQTDPCPAGSERPDYKGSRRTENLLQVARVEMGKVPFHIPRPPDEDCSPRLAGAHDRSTSVPRHTSLGYPIAPPSSAPRATEPPSADLSSPRSDSLSSPAPTSGREVGRTPSLASAQKSLHDQHYGGDEGAGGHSHVAPGGTSDPRYSVSDHAPGSVLAADQPERASLSAASPKVNLSSDRGRAGSLSESDWGQEALAAVQKTSLAEPHHPQTSSSPQELTNEYLNRSDSADRSSIPPVLDQKQGSPSAEKHQRHETHDYHPDQDAADAYDMHDVYDAYSALAGDVGKQDQSHPPVPPEGQTTHQSPTPAGGHLYAYNHAQSPLPNPHGDESTEANHSPRGSLDSADVPNFGYDGPLRVVNADHNPEDDDLDARSDNELPAYTPNPDSKESHASVPPPQQSASTKSVPSGIQPDPAYHFTTSPQPPEPQPQSPTGPVTDGVSAPAVSAAHDHQRDRSDDFVGSTRAAQAAVRHPMSSMGGFESHRSSPRLPYGGEGDLPSAPSPAPKQKVIPAGAFRRNFFRKPSSDASNASSAPLPPVSQVAASAPTSTSSPPPMSEPGADSAYVPTPPLQINKRESAAPPNPPSPAPPTLGDTGTAAVSPPPPAHPQSAFHRADLSPPRATAASPSSNPGYLPYSTFPPAPPMSSSPRPPGAYAAPAYGYGQQYSDPYAAYSQGQYPNPYGQ